MQRNICEPPRKKRDYQKMTPPCQRLWGFADVVRVRYIVARRVDFEPCWPALRTSFADAPPAATMIVAGLADPRMRIKIEVTARLPV
jgi:enamine deaminase RidA (YjgF/YER057c/UK114 family)